VAALGSILADRSSVSYGVTPQLRAPLQKRGRAVNLSAAAAMTVIKITRLIRAIDQEAAVWVERADRFPGSTAGACLILKKLGVDAVLAQPFPNFLIFSTDDLRYEEIVLRKKTSDLSRAQRTAAFKSQSRWANSGTFF
jgi:hypothetical protein